MDLRQLRPIDRTPMRPRKSRWPRLVVLTSVFLVLLYLYLGLTQPPLPPGGAEANGVRSVFSIYGWGKERLSSPNGVASDKAGNIYIADTGNHRVAVFDRRGNFRFVFGKKARTPSKQALMGPIAYPLSLAVAENGEIYVACMSRNYVFVFDANGNFKRQISVDRPIALALAKDRLYVSTPGPILVFSLRGDLLNRWGSQGRGVAEFEYPNGLALDRQGNLFVSDTLNARIQIFNRAGRLIGIKGRPPLNLNDPQRLFGLNMGLTMDEQERVYVADAFSHSIQVFDHEGNELGEYGEQGEFDGRFNYPSGLAYLGGGTFAVADKWNDRVQVIKLMMPIAPGKIAEQAQSAVPYVLLALLVLLLLFLSWRRRRLILSERALAGGLGRVRAG